MRRPAGVLMPNRLGVGALIGRPSPRSYSTTFAATEDPLLDDGGWVRGLADGLDWTDPQTGSGNVYGKQNDSGFDDSIACRMGYAANHWASGVIHKGSTLAIMEVEILLRWQISANVARGYEINLAHDGAYCQVVRWEGALNSFTYLQSNFGTQTSPADGDTFYAEINGNIITVKQNGSTLGTVDITAGSPANIWNAGNPGLGFYTTTASPNSAYGFQSWQAGEL